MEIGFSQLSKTVRMAECEVNMQRESFRRSLILFYAATILELYDNVRPLAKLISAFICVIRHHLPVRYSPFLL